jgi:betaine-aldehyde dehydrogenase
VAAAKSAFDDGPWPHMAPAERAEVFRRIRAAVADRVEEMSLAFSVEIGAPLAVSQAFHANALAIWDNHIELLEKLELEEDRQDGDRVVRVVHEPVGVFATILPWNGPVATASLKMAPALAAGCPVVVKPAPEGPISMMLLAEAIEAADLPEGVVSILPAGREVGEHLVKHPDVDKVSFTGSTAAGRRIMALCADRIARVTLELGGKSAGIIADDIPLDGFLPGLVFAGIGHTGQVCAALTRVLVPRHRQDEVVEAIREILASIVVGDPFEEGTVLGPLAAERQRARVEEYIAVGVAEGATLALGGGRPADRPRGWYVEPTVFSDVDSSMRVAQEEIFGPVICVIPFDDVDDAVRIANDSIYGLSGAVYAADTQLAESIARRVRTGQVTVNDWGMCVTQPTGGFKQSGLGREGGLEGIQSYFETKVIFGLD